MTPKDVIRKLLPPILIDGIKAARRGAFRQARPEWEVVPAGWRVSDPRIRGWNVATVMDSYRSRWPAFLRTIEGPGPLGVVDEKRNPSEHESRMHSIYVTFGYVLALAARNRRRLSILDWGAGLGEYSVLSRCLLPSDVVVDYYCKEVPILCGAGRDLLPHVSFVDDDDICFSRTYDLVIASNSMQYAQDWQTLADRLVAASRRYLYITSLPIVNSTGSYVVVQRPSNGYQTEYVGWFLNRAQFLRYMKETGVELVREFLIPERPFVHGAPQQTDYRGFLFRTAHADTIC